MSEVVKIALDKIVFDSERFVDIYSKEELQQLADSIKKEGLIEPIGVRQLADNFLLVSGEKRYLACQLAGIEEIEALVLNDESLINEVQKASNNPLRQALAMESLMKQEGLTQSQLAIRLGYKQSTVANKLRLLKLPEVVIRDLSLGNITERHARALLKVPFERQEEVFRVIKERNYNVGKTEEYIRSILEENIHRKGITGNVQIGINTINQAYEMVRKAGIDGDYQISDYSDVVKIVIKLKK